MKQTPENFLLFSFPSIGVGVCVLKVEMIEFSNISNESGHVYYSFRLDLFIYRKFKYCFGPSHYSVFYNWLMFSFLQVIDPDDLPQRARWTIIATACLLLIMCLLLVGVTLRMAPFIDDMGEWICF